MKVQECSKSGKPPWRMKPQLPSLGGLRGRSRQEGPRTSEDRVVYLPRDLSRGCSRPGLADCARVPAEPRDATVKGAGAGLPGHASLAWALF